MPKYEFTDEQRLQGGITTSKLPAKGPCPLCGMRFERHVQLAGHLGLHAFAENNGFTLQQAREKLGIMGAAATDPFPYNGAYAEGHELLRQYRDG